MLLIVLFSLPGFISLVFHAASWVNADSVVIGDTNGSYALLTTKPDDSPKAIFYTADDKGVLSMELTPTGFASLSMRTTDGSRALDITTATPTGAAMIVLYDPATGSAAWSLTLDENGAPIISD